MVTCLILVKTKQDDPMENFAIYGTAAFFSMIMSIFFLPNTGILWGNSDSGTMLGD